MPESEKEQSYLEKAINRLGEENARLKVVLEERTEISNALIQENTELKDKLVKMEKEVNEHKSLVRNYNKFHEKLQVYEEFVAEEDLEDSFEKYSRKFRLRDLIEEIRSLKGDDEIIEFIMDNNLDEG